MRNIYSTLLLAIITSLTLLSVANCDVPTSSVPYVFSPPTWIRGSWQDEHHRFTAFTFSEHDIDIGGNYTLTELYANAKETSDEVSTDNSMYTITLANSIHTFTKTNDKTIIKYSFKRLDIDKAESNIKLKYFQKE